MRKRLLNLAKLLKKMPSDPYMRGKFVICKREYRKFMRENKRTFEVANLDKIQSLTTTPKQFWNCIKNNLSKSKSRAGGNNIPPDTWVTHFSGLNKKDPESIPENLGRCEYVNNNIESIISESMCK